MLESHVITVVNENNIIAIDELILKLHLTKDLLIDFQIPEGDLEQDMLEILDRIGEWT